MQIRQSQISSNKENNYDANNFSKYWRKLEATTSFFTDWSIDGAIAANKFPRLDWRSPAMADYQPQLKLAIAAIKILETTSPDSDEFCNALAELHVCTTILEPYSQGMLESIEQFTEDDSISVDS